MSEILGLVVKAVHGVFGLLKDYEIERRTQRRHGIREPYECKPTKLKTKSRRPLTPPLPFSTLPSLLRPQRKEYKEQLASPLYAKLPTELRLLIWEMCLQTGVHVTWENGHMRSFQCSLENPEHLDFGTLWYCDEQRRSREKKRDRDARDKDVPKGRLNAYFNMSKNVSWILQYEFQVVRQMKEDFLGV